MSGTMRVITNAGPGVKHDIQRALNVRNLNPKTALTQEQVAYLDHAGSYEPKPRLKDNATADLRSLSISSRIARPRQVMAKAGNGQPSRKGGETSAEWRQKGIGSV
jgi:hypothetical protein